VINEKNYPWVALGKARALEGEFPGIGFPWCEASRVPTNSISSDEFLGATTLRLPVQHVLELWKGSGTT
jgi:hypothetical protein